MQLVLNLHEFLGYNIHGLLKKRKEKPKSTKDLIPPFLTISAETNNYIVSAPDVVAQMAVTTSADGTKQQMAAKKNLIKKKPGVFN